jgi:hypothetical protein
MVLLPLLSLHPAFGYAASAGAALAPGASSFDSWPSKDMDGPLGSSSGSYGRALGSLSSDPRGDRYNASRDCNNERYNERRKAIQYSKQHLEDLKDMMMFKLKMEELPLPRGLSIEVLEHLYKKAADEEVRSRTCLKHIFWVPFDCFSVKLYKATFTIVCCPKACTVHFWGVEHRAAQNGGAATAAGAEHRSAGA